MRRSDRQITKEEAMNILKNGEYGILATIGEKYPYGVPVNHVVLNDKIYFHGTLESGLKTDNIRKSPNVSFTVVSNTKVLADKFSEQYESAIAFGKASFIEGEEKEAALKEFIYKYSADFEEKGMKYVQAAKDKAAIWGITIEEVTGKARR